MTLSREEMTSHIAREEAFAVQSKSWCNAASWTLSDETLRDANHDVQNSLHQAGIQLQTEAARFYSAATELFDKANRAERLGRCPSIPLHYRVVAGKLERHADELRQRGDALRDAQRAIRNNMVRPVAPQL